MANTRRKHWRKRLDQAARVLLAAVMVLQLSAGGLSVAFASDEQGQEEPPQFQVENENQEKLEEAEDFTPYNDISDDSGNLLVNGSFANNGEGWETHYDAASLEFPGNAAVFKITGGAADWGQSLFQQVSGLEAGYEYIVTAVITSTINRTVLLGFEGTAADREFSCDLEANVPTNITYTTEKAGTGGKFGIYLGGTDYGEHDVTISNVRVVKGDKIKMPGEDTEDGVPVDEVVGNLLTNGSFANKGEGWTAETANADVYFNAYRTVFYLRGNTADWQQGLKRPLDLPGGAKYKVTFTVETSEKRTVSVNLRNVETGAAYVSQPIPVGVPTEVSFVTDGAARDGGSFYLYLGGADAVYPHSVVISNISIVEIPVELPDTENNEAPTPIQSIVGTIPAEMTVLKDGNFTQGLNKWETWAGESGSAEFVPAENGGMTVQIGANGYAAWCVQLNQKIDLKAGNTYTISFDVETDKDRAFNVVLIDQNNEVSNSHFSKPVAVRAGENGRHVSLNFTPEQDLTNETFSLQLGQIDGNKPNTNLTFKNMKIEVNGYSEKAALIPDGDFTEGLGAFAPNGNVSVQNGSVTATGGTLIRSITGMEPGVSYTLSFMAGSVDEGSITVTLPNGDNKTFDLTDDAKLCTVDFTAAGETGNLTFDFGTDSNIICLDTVRLDAAGYAEAAGLDAAQHDITRLTKNQAPLLSEMALAEFGKDVVLTFSSDENYEKAISSVTIDGSEVDYTVESGKIVLDKGLFVKTASSDRQTYNITVSAYWYTDNHAIQIVYDQGVFQSNYWSDEFNGNALDENVWGYQDGTGAEYGLDGWGNNEQQYYTRDNLKVADGAMTITATKGSHSKKYDSARIWTRNQAGTETYFSQTYGRLEAKMKLPAGEGCDGLWPAFWLLPVDTGTYGGWPVSGEIDIRPLAKLDQAVKITDTSN